MKLYTVSLLVLFSGCFSKQECGLNFTKVFTVSPVNLTLKLPEYIITDTISWGDIENVYGRNLSSKDTMWNLNISITDYDRLTPSTMPSFEHRLKVANDEVLELPSDSMVLYPIKSKKVGTVQIGMAGSFNKVNHMRVTYIFLNRGMLYTRIYIFEPHAKFTDGYSAFVDCVYENISVK